MRFRLVSNEVLLEELKNLLVTEKFTTAEVVEYVRELDRRRLYLEHGHTSLFSFLTKGLGYAAASAQRRIDSARLLDSVPELKQALESGDLNLTQISMMAHAVRQKQKEEPSLRLSAESKQDLLNKIKNQDTRETEKILAQELGLEIKIQEKLKTQRDESVRIEVTFSKEDMESFNRVKEMISHIHPNPSWGQVMSYLALEFVKRKDPRAVKPSKTKSNSVMHLNEVENSTSAAEAAPHQAEFKAFEATGNPRFISAAKRRVIILRDDSCRWKCAQTGERCGSRFQLQIDHIQPVWAGGTNEIENLQALCGVHNRHKYRGECGGRFQSDFII
jgi:hypothetical protein